jgi:hypothetical protein
MTYFAEKLIGLVLCTVFGFTVALGAPSGQSEPVTTIALAPYLIEPTTTTSSTSSTVFIDPYASACEQFSALAVNLGWPADQRTVLEAVMFSESRCIPKRVNGKDPNGGHVALCRSTDFGHPGLLSAVSLQAQKTCYRQMLICGQR